MKHPGIQDQARGSAGTPGGQMPQINDSSGDSRFRFDIAIQKTRFALYCSSYLIGVVALKLGVISIDFVLGTILVAVAIVSSLVIAHLHKAGFEQKTGINLLYVWTCLDIIAISTGVFMMGGLESPWFLWYLTVWAAAAFTGGSRVSFLLAGFSAICYGTALWLAGDITGLDGTVWSPLFRMVFLFWASFYFLRGIGDLSDKRQMISRLKNEESQKVEELTRLARELDQRTRQLAVANKRIVEADRMKSRFLANMSHELRTPMNSIIGFSEILIERLQGKIEEKHIEFQQHILSSGQHLLSIINDVLDLSKIEAGKMGVYPERLSVRQIVDSVRHIMKSQAVKQGVEFRVEIPDDLPEIETDLAKLKQVFYNLLSNAVKFSPRHSVVTISAKHQPGDGSGSVTISIRDQGEGISVEEQSLVFEEFQQTSSGLKHGSGGTGLGLALVKRFIELQHGHISLESEPKVGTTFHITFPVDFQGSVEAPEEKVDLDSRPGERVLVVEDDDDAYLALSRDLEAAAYIPVRARHGDEAIRMANLANPVAITLDLVIPGTDGWEVLKILKANEQTRDIPVVIISLLDNRDLGMALGADDYFLKPFDRHRFIDRLRQLTGLADDSSKPRLLLIDDDKSLRELLNRELGDRGYEVDLAVDGPSGIRMAAERLPDVIILDLVMPGLNGFEVIEILRSRKETAHIPVVVFTAKDLSQDDRDLLKANMAAVVQKEVGGRSRLVTMIRNLETRQALIR